jgi:DNA-binding GntR family transcriptional regulator
MSREPAKYETVANDLHQRMISGEYPPGSKLPSIADLQQHYGSSMGTVERALALLREKRLITTRQGMGSYVRGGVERSKLELKLADGRELRVLSYDTGAVRIHLGEGPYVLSEIQLKGDGDGTIMIELSPGGQGSAAYTNRT